MWGTVSSVSICRHRLAPPLIATIAAAGVAGVIATAARASAPDESPVAKTEAAAPPGIKLKFDATVVEPMAATLRAKLDVSGAAQKTRRLALKPRAACITGIASMYNPNKPGDRSGGAETASGEPYAAEAWAAAIQIGLRTAFDGVRFGRNYRPAFALVTAGEKSAIIRINDVGPLLPGRVIDLTERTMRYFDATLERGLVADVKVMPLQGTDWRSGPLADGPAQPMAGDVLPATIH